MITTVFEHIPDLFVQVYDQQFQIWAREYRKRGPRCAIVFRHRPGEVALLDAGGREIARGAWLEATHEFAAGGERRMVIRPMRELDAEVIAEHCRELRGHVLQ